MKHLEVIIEIPKSSEYKYEVDKHTGELTIDRVLNQLIPANYGYVPWTFCEDNDELDIFVISRRPIPPLTKVKVNVYGVFKCLDKGKCDDKLVATLEGESIEDYTVNLSKIKTFLETYKVGFEVLSYHGVVTAEEVYNATKV